jgi:hypothetical protein
VELYDTPGLEDSIGLLDHLQGLRGDRRVEGVDAIKAFLESPEALGKFEQEAKALRQVLASDVALYVVDARDRVLSKHRDELEILGLCSRPVVGVLNFTADEQAQTPVWRQQLARANMHAVAEFDTVVVDEVSEQRLFEKMQSLLDSHRQLIEGLIDDRQRLRRAIGRASAALVSEMLIDAAAFVVSVPTARPEEMALQVDKLKESVRRREQMCVDGLLALHRFRPEDCGPNELPITDGKWGMDPFNPEALKQFGVRAGGGAAAGALAGLAVDVAVGGLSLGTGAAIGAAIGGLLGAAGTYGRRVLGRLRGYLELRCDDPTLLLLAARQVLLVQALMRRGHASTAPMQLDAAGGRKPWSSSPRPLRRAKTHPRWSTLHNGPGAWRGGDPDRQLAVDELAALIEQAVGRQAGAVAKIDTPTSVR